MKNDPKRLLKREGTASTPALAGNIDSRYVYSPPPHRKVVVFIGFSLHTDHGLCHNYLISICMTCMFLISPLPMKVVSDMPDL
jgi:hypothetical protein